MKKFKVLKNALYIFILVLAASCKMDKIEPMNVSSGNQDSFVIVETETNSSYFKPDSLIHINLSDGLLYNLGVGKDISSSVEGLSIFNQNISLKPIVSLSLNESFSKRFILSCDYGNSNRLEDSILTNVLKLDSSKAKHASSNGNTDFLIYGKMIFYKKFGTAKINKSNPLINDYLTYKTNLFQRVDKDGITITPDLFKGIFGTAYRDSLVLGVFVNANFTISGVDLKDNTYEESLQEVSEILEKLKDGNLKWDELKVNSIHLKQSSLLISDYLAIPRINFINSMDKLIEEIGQMDGFYKKADFGILSDGYLPFSSIYPDYKFL